MTWHCTQIPNDREPLVVCERDTLRAEIETLQQAISDLAPIGGRYVVLCDDGSVIATDEPYDDDHVIADRGGDW